MMLRGLITFDLQFRSRKNLDKIPTLPGPGALKWNYTQPYHRFEHDDASGKTQLQKSEIHEVLKTFTITYAIKEQRLFILRSSLYDAIRGREDSLKEQTKTSYCLRRYQPVKDASIMIGGDHPPYLDWEILKEKMATHHPVRYTPLYFQRVARMKSAILEVEKSVLARQETAKLHCRIIKKLHEEHLNPSKYDYISICASYYDGFFSLA